MPLTLTIKWTFIPKDIFLQIECTNFSRQVNFKSVMGCDDDVIVDRQM